MDEIVGELNAQTLFFGSHPLLLLAFMLIYTELPQ